MKFQISIRELMFVVFVIGLGLAGLSRGGVLASLCVILLFTAATALAIVAFVGHGRRRVFGIGYIIPFFLYIVPHAYVGSSELDPYGKLPTTRLWQPVFQRVVKWEYFDSSGQPLPDYDPTPGRGTGGLKLAGGPAAVNVSESPPRATFMLLAHALLASAMAYCGGKFAIWVSGREPR